MRALRRRLERVFWSLHSATWDDLETLPKFRDSMRERIMWLADLSRRSGERVLDLGCGTGIYCDAFSQAGFDVIGVDYAHAMLQRGVERAQRALRARSVEFVNADANRMLPFLDASFD